MALFVVPVQEIDRVWPHPGADRLELASVRGLSWQFAVGKGEYRPGDRVVYFPIDSLLPEPLIELLGVRSFLAGAGRNRVKTARLRGEISQGLVVALPKIAAYLGREEFQPELGRDLRELLGVIKHDPPAILSDNEALVAMPGHVSVFDVEGADNFPRVVELLLDLPVVVTEKLEGTNWWCTAQPDGEVQVGQHRHGIVERPGAENAYWRAARRQGLVELCSRLAVEQGCTFTLRGELVGPKIQANYYKLNEQVVYVYAAERNSRYLPSLELFSLLPPEQLVPRLTPETGPMPTLREWLAGRSVREASDGPSRLAPSRLREGIVIVPVEEQRHPEIGRLMLKQRSPQYLAKTEF